MTERCLKHKIFISHRGCPICKEIAEIRTDFEMKIVDKNLEIIELKKQLKDLESKELPITVKNAIKYLSRNEKQTILNIYGSQSMLVAVVDHINNMPETPRKAAIKPLFDYIIDTGSTLDSLCDLMAVKMSSEIGATKFNDLIADCSTVVDILGGIKMRSCLTCIKYLDQKAENKIAIKNHIGWKIAIKR